MSVSVDDLLEPFHVDLGPDFRDRNKIRAGQLCWATVCYMEEQRQYWRPTNYDAMTSTAATSFMPTSSGTDFFNRPLPIHQPHLATDEEFPLMRAKRRPAIVVSTPEPTPMVPARRDFLILPGFGFTRGSTDILKAGVTATLIERVRRLEFPNLFFCPAKAPLLQKDGFHQIDLLHTVPVSCLIALSEGAFKVLQSQIQYRLFGTYVDPYASLRELLLNQ